jgi:uncharacterized lipoprotein YehR (DUF1307 family)
MHVLRKTATALAAATLAVGISACGEDRSGDVKFEGDTGTTTTETGTTATTATTGTETTP